MARYYEAPGSQTEAIDTIIDQLNAATQGAYSAVTADDPTLTAAQLVNGIINLAGQTTAQDVTTPTAEAILALLPNAQVGTLFEFCLQNANTSSGAVTLIGGSGVTIVSGSALAITKSQLYRGRVTGVDTPAVSVYGLLTAPV